jgi:predicted RNase H-like nuclease
MHRAEGKGMTRQSWSIVGKVREVDDVLRRAPELQTRVREVHPEVSFWCLAGEPMQHRKRSRPGHEERFELLKPLFGHRLQEVLDEVHDKLMRRDCGDDDLLDAFAALWTAERVAAGTSLTLPRHPALDSAGLRMEIVA